ncbi:uncharacterized protein BYT42DRAFT_614076 [Radiomyces spectabilis]|uniref:uncharacterized protein n=1 Tax=Radiomyces spectabilis TaxID=64574 RepID=UPI002220E58A|nr:uncharacterized protein BYT42DRAFT_614076 [Radiomyces spectabilis]KAI8377386.1 hypothetical protein BYT42DRAFT_614076 [Radiomyces spectabilis]
MAQRHERSKTVLEVNASDLMTAVNLRTMTNYVDTDVIMMADVIQKVPRVSILRQAANNEHYLRAGEVLYYFTHKLTLTTDLNGVNPEFRHTFALVRCTSVPAIRIQASMSAECMFGGIPLMNRIGRVFCRFSASILPWQFLHGFRNRHVPSACAKKQKRHHRVGLEEDSAVNAADNNESGDLKLLTSIELGSDRSVEHHPRREGVYNLIEENDAIGEEASISLSDEDEDRDVDIRSPWALGGIHIAAACAQYREDCLAKSNPENYQILVYSGD